MSWNKFKPMMGYMIFVSILIFSSILYFNDQDQERKERCLDSRRDIRGAIEWTVGYALGFDPNNTQNPEETQRFVDGLHTGLEEQFSDKDCR